MCKFCQGELDIYNKFQHEPNCIAFKPDTTFKKPQVKLAPPKKKKEKRDLSTHAQAGNSTIDDVDEIQDDEEKAI